MTAYVLHPDTRAENTGGKCRAIVGHVSPPSADPKTSLH